MAKLIIDDLISSFTHSSQIQIHFVNADTTYQFNTFNFPREFMGIEILSIEPPDINDKPSPLCINIDEILWFNNIKKIKRKFKDYEV